MYDSIQAYAHINILYIYVHPVLIQVVLIERLFFIVTLLNIRCLSELDDFEEPKNKQRNENKN